MCLIAYVLTAANSISVPSYDIQYRRTDFESVEFDLTYVFCRSQWSVDDRPPLVLSRRLSLTLYRVYLLFSVEIRNMYFYKVELELLLILWIDK